jgi:hypothetical protein
MPAPAKIFRAYRPAGTVDAASATRSPGRVRSRSPRIRRGLPGRTAIVIALCAITRRRPVRCSSAASMVGTSAVTSTSPAPCRDSPAAISCEPPNENRTWTSRCSRWYATPSSRSTSRVDEAASTVSVVRPGDPPQPPATAPRPRSSSAAHAMTRRRRGESGICPDLRVRPVPLR